MTKIDGGDPAFPAAWKDSHPQLGGMSLRDYFAGQVIVGMLTNPMYDGNSSTCIAQVAYMQADAMLKERSG